jgi:hypothetical protein
MSDEAREAKCKLVDELPHIVHLQSFDAAEACQYLMAKSGKISRTLIRAVHEECEHAGRSYAGAFEMLCNNVRDKHLVQQQVYIRANIPHIA